MKKISVIISGHNTSISLEEDFCVALKNIASERGMSIRLLLEDIDKQLSENKSGGHNLSSYVRCYILNYYLQKLTN